MKTKNFHQLFFLFILTVGLSGCFKSFKEDILIKTNTTPKSKMEEINVPATFNFSTTGEVKFKIGTFDNTDRPIKGVIVSIYSYPEEKLLIKGITSATGVIQINQSIPAYVKTVSVRPNFIGLPSEFIIDVVNNNVDVTFGGKNETTPKTVRESESQADNRSFRGPTDTEAKYPPLVMLGSFDSKGVPKYLESTRDLISAEFLANIDASVPEQRPVTISNPAYLNLTNKNTLTISELADVWITFVHEGAGWTNVLGFYTFDLNKPPTKTKDISEITVIFPNVSYSGSNGGLKSGDKVKIGRFPAGTGIGFVLFANGFNTSKSTIEDGNYAHFSHEALNIESKSELRRHLIVLNDPATNRLVLTFEDTDRASSGCDQDFNDAIFFASSNPVKAISKDSFPAVINTKDSDGDGVGDTQDEYPNDPIKAISNYIPSQNSYGSLAYEDLWPSKGDYDMNDLVINYQFQEIYNTNNQVIELNAKIYVKAILAKILNGWGFQLPIPSSSVKSVTGQSLLYKVISNSANGTESEQDYATVIAFDNSFDQIKGGKSDTLNLKIVFSTPINKSVLGTAPYNPFIFQRDNRGNEVHLVNFPPTQKINKSLFGTLNDRSSTLSGIYYKSESRLPWALNIPEDFTYPLEGEAIINGYLYFKDWSESGGTSYPDWYVKKNGYINSDKLSK